MDDLELIRSLRADPRAVDLEGRARARARLEQHVMGRRPRRRPPRLAVLSAAMAVLLIGAVTLAVLNARTARPREATKPAASPAELLRQAAGAARAAPPEPALAAGYWYSQTDRLEARGGPYRHDLRFRQERWVDLSGRGRLRMRLRSARFPTARDRRAHDRQGAPFTRRPFRVDDTGRPPVVLGAGGWIFGDNNLLDLRGLRRLPTDAAALEERLRRLSGRDGDLLADLTRVLADAPLRPALRASMYEVLATLDGLRLAERPPGLGRLPTGTAFVGRSAGPDGNVDTVVALDPRAGRVLAQVSVLVKSRGRGGLGDFRSGDRIGEYRWGPSGEVPSTADRP